jgi:hypothetical protein
MWDHANAHERARALPYPKKGRDSIVLTYPLHIVVRCRKYYHIQWICKYNAVRKSCRTALSKPRKFKYLNIRNGNPPFEMELYRVSSELALKGGGSQLNRKRRTKQS